MTLSNQTSRQVHHKCPICGRWWTCHNENCHENKKPVICDRCSGTVQHDAK